MAYQQPNILYQPHRGPQTWFHQAGAQVVCFGGARGGGKSMALLMESTRRAHHPEYKALISRRTYPQLAELIGRAHRYLPKLGFTWKGDGKMYVHANGGYIKFMSFQHEKDVENVVGHEYHWLGIDQVEQFSEYMVQVLESSVRSSVPDLRTYIRYTSNPGSIGHLWVKERFVDACRPIPAGDPIHMKQYNITWQPVKPGPIYADKSGRTHQFIPSRVFDNPSLFVNDPQYVRSLQALPEKLRMAHLFGDYDVFEGQFFSNWNHDAHVIEPFEIPIGWQLYGGYDYGRTAPACYLLAAVDWDDNVYIIREFYQADKSIEEQAAAIRAIEAPFIARGFNEPSRVADPSIWAKIPKDLINPTYPTDDTIEMMFRDKRNRIHFTKANNNRKSGWSAMREMLEFENRPGKTSRVRVFGKYCTNLVRTLPAMVVSSTDPEDIDTDTEDHACFAAGTKVTTISGDKDIEALKVGDLVLTRVGFKPVVAVAMTSDNAEVFEYSFSNGVKLQCTNDHPVFSDGEFKKISSLTLCDTVTILEKREFLTNGVNKISEKFIGTLPVYNITVDEQHEFYANSVLVKNCDAARYLLMAVYRPDRQKPKKLKTWREDHLRPVSTDGGVIHDGHEAILCCGCWWSACYFYLGGSTTIQCREEQEYQFYHRVANFGKFCTAARIPACYFDLG